MLYRHPPRNIFQEHGMLEKKMLTRPKAGAQICSINQAGKLIIGYEMPKCLLNAEVKSLSGAKRGQAMSKIKAKLRLE